MGYFSMGAERRRKRADPAEPAEACVVDGGGLHDAGVESFGLVVQKATTAAGEVVYTVSGNTRAHRLALREAGGRWDAAAGHWVYAGTDPRPLLAERLAGAGLSDSASPVSIADRPHYWGHRQRLRDRFLGSREDSLPDYELLELLLFFSVRIRDTKPLAKKLLEDFGSFGSVLNAAPERLQDFSLLGEDNNLHHTLALFKAVRVLAARMSKEDASEGTVLTNWDKLIAYLRTSMAHRTVEQFRVLFLDRRNVLIADEIQNEGSIDHTPVYPREVVKRALTLDASAVIMVHNHPSNHPTPSQGDIDMTRVVKQALHNVGVVLHDHVIVSRKGHSSFKQMGLL